jgi:phosphatidylserine decarboxylase
MSLFVPAAVLNHFAKAALAGYATFNDFYTRALKNGAIIVRLMLCCVL